MNLALVVIWSVMITLLATGYGWYAGWRQARLHPITPAGWVRHGLVFYAIVVLVFVLPFLPSLRNQSFGIIVEQIQSLAVMSLAPLGLWYCFEIPLRLVRRFTQAQKGEVIRSDPFAGPVSPKRSFLDQIAERKARATVEPEPSQS